MMDPAYYKYWCNRGNGWDYQYLTKTIRTSKALLDRPYSLCPVQLYETQALTH